MPYCKYCKRPVQATNVWHPECRAKKMEELLQDYCDYYCKWAVVCLNKERLLLHCDRCPRRKIVGLGL